MCRPPGIKAKARQRTARRSVPATLSDKHAVKHLDRRKRRGGVRLLSWEISSPAGKGINKGTNIDLSLLVLLIYPKSEGLFAV